jgi:hypothetical protein
VEGILFPRFERGIAGIGGETKWVIQGVWKQPTYKVRQPFEIVFTSDQFQSFKGFYMSGVSEGVWNGDRKAGSTAAPAAQSGGAVIADTTAQSPIINVCVVAKGAAVPPGYTKLAKSAGGSDAQLDKEGYYLCVQRAALPKAEEKKQAPAAASAADDEAALIAAALAASVAEMPAAGAAPATPAAAAPATPAPAAAAATPASPAPATPAAAVAPATPAAAPASAEPQPITDLLVIANELDSVPEGYEPVLVHGKPNTKYLSSGGELPLSLYVSRKPSADKKVLWDLNVIWGSEKVPTGFTKLSQTPVMMEADLAGNQNFCGRAHQLYVVLHKCPPKTKEQIATERAALERHPVEGKYTSSHGEMTIRLTSGKLRGQVLNGKYKSGHADVRGVLFTTAATASKPAVDRWMGTYRNAPMKYPGVAIFEFDAKRTEIKGTSSFSMFLLLLLCPAFCGWFGVCVFAFCVLTELCALPTSQMRLSPIGTAAKISSP